MSSLYKCLSCGFHYESEKLAQKCREWCSKHASYHAELIKNSIEYQEMPGQQIKNPRLQFFSYG